MPNRNQDKILQLLYTGDIANDKIAFEIIKSDAISDTIYPSLIALAMTTEDNAFRSEIYKYIQPNLTTEQQNLIENQFKYKQQLSYHQLKEYFKEPFIFEILYCSFKRTGENPQDLLRLGDGSHPEREDFFNAFCESHQNSTYVKIPGLLNQEIEIYFSNLQNSSQIYHLEITDLKADVLPNCIISNKISKVSINHNKTTFPSYIFKLKTESLEINLLQYSDFPEDWSELGMLKQLNFTGKNHVFSNLNFLKSLPKLTKFSIGNNFLNNPTNLLLPKRIPFTRSINFENKEGFEASSLYNAFKLNQDEVLQLAAALAKSKLTREEQEYYLKKIANLTNLKKVSEFPLPELIALMTLNFKKLTVVTQQGINGHCVLKNNTIKLRKTAILHFSGTPTIKKTELKEKLKTLQIASTGDPKKASHIVICKKPKNYTVLQSLKFKVVSETCIYDLFKQKSPGFIEEAATKGDTTITNNLTDLLQSNDPQNIAIGIEMLKTGGVPAVLIDTLLIVFKTCKDSKIRGEAKKLLLKNAASELLPLINDTQRFTSILTQKAQEINLKLEKVAKNSSPELAAHLSILFQQHLKKGLRYVLYHFHVPSEIRTRGLLSLMDDGHFNFHEGLGFTNWKKRGNLDDVTIYKLKTKNKFPVDIVDHATVISANFHNCKLTTISSGIGNFKDVKKLDLSYNLAKKLPNSFHKLNQLEHLDLQMNSFEKFPEVLLKLPKLKFIDFRRNTIQHVLSPIEITDEIKLALPNCEILV